MRSSGQDSAEAGIPVFAQIKQSISIVLHHIIVTHTEVIIIIIITIIIIIILYKNDYYCKNIRLTVPKLSKIFIWSALQYGGRQSSCRLQWIWSMS